jgi:hypothetical protein
MSSGDNVTALTNAVTSYRPLTFVCNPKRSAMGIVRYSHLSDDSFYRSFVIDSVRTVYLYHSPCAMVCAFPLEKQHLDSTH